jgi:hypothetical protein
MMIDPKQLKGITPQELEKVKADLGVFGGLPKSPVPDKAVLPYVVASPGKDHA